MESISHPVIWTETLLEVPRHGHQRILLVRRETILFKDTHRVSFEPVEVLARYERTRKKKGHSWEISSGTFQLKIQDYAMFDDVIFYTFRRSKWKPPMSDDTGAPPLQMETSDTDARRE